MVVNQNIVGYTFPQYFNTNNFPELRISDTFISRVLFTLRDLYTLPTQIVFESSLFIGRWYYQYRNSNPVLLTWLLFASYLANAFLLPIFLLQLMHLFNTLNYLIFTVATVLILANINKVRYDTLGDSSDATVLLIEKEIRTTLNEEDDLEKRRIKMEALTTTKKLFLLMRRRMSLNYIYAMMSVIFVNIKCRNAQRFNTQKEYDSLEAETDQALSLLAQSQA